MSVKEFSCMHFMGTPGQEGTCGYAVDVVRRSAKQMDVRCGPSIQSVFVRFFPDGYDGTQTPSIAIPGNDEAVKKAPCPMLNGQWAPMRGFVIPV